jgi:hypothetical protein
MQTVLRAADTSRTFRIQNPVISSSTQQQRLAGAQQHQDESARPAFKKTDHVPEHKMVRTDSQLQTLDTFMHLKRHGSSSSNPATDDVKKARMEDEENQPPSNESRINDIQNGPKY